MVLAGAGVSGHEHRLAALRGRAEVVHGAVPRLQVVLHDGRRRVHVVAAGAAVAWRHRPAVAVGQPGEALVDPREGVRHVVQLLLVHLARGQVEPPPPHQAGLEVVRPAVPHGGVTACVQPHMARFLAVGAVVPGVHDVEHVAERHVEPAGRLTAAGAVAVQQADAGAVLGLPAERHRAGHRHLQVEHHGQVEEDRVVAADGEVVHHRGPGHVDRLGVHQVSLGVGNVVRDVRRPQQFVPEEVHLARRRAGVRVRRHRALQPAVEITRAQGVQLW